MRWQMKLLALTGKYFKNELGVLSSMNVVFLIRSFVFSR